MKDTNKCPHCLNGCKQCPRYYLEDDIKSDESDHAIDDGEIYHICNEFDPGLQGPIGPGTCEACKEEEKQQSEAEPTDQEEEGKRISNITRGLCR